jgi:hypothetical protein
MLTLVARIAPQRSTQYAALAATLALPEWQFSPLGRVLACTEKMSLGGGDYLWLKLARPINDADRVVMGLLAMTSEFFEFHPRIGGVEGPFLKPLVVPYPAFLPLDIVFTRRYRGKTNELFTRFLLNAAYFGSDFASAETIPHLTVLDPLCGGGTTLFQALVYGWDAYGVDKNERAIATTDTFLQQYLRGEGVTFRRRKERLRGIGRRYSFELNVGQGQPRRCVLAQADTAQVGRVLEGKKVHLVVADLPYGIQHKGALTDLLQGGLPVWATSLRHGGAMALAWESTRLSRQEMSALVEEGGDLTVLRGGPYEALGHQVDRVIKERDVVVARRVKRPS